MPLESVHVAHKTGRNIDNIGHDVHFWGAVFGFFFTIALKPALALYFFNTVKSLFG